MFGDVIVHSRAIKNLNLRGSLVENFLIKGHVKKPSSN